MLEKYKIGSLRSLRFLINEEKYNLTPSMIFLYLGIVWNTLTWTVSLKQKRAESIRKAASALLSAVRLTGRDLAKFVGKIQSTVGIVPLARIRTRAIMYDMAAQCRTTDDYDSECTISDQAKVEIMNWANMPDDLCMDITDTEPVFNVDTDASLDFLVVSIISEDIELSYHICLTNKCVAIKTIKF